jgi:hypothetical protein
MRAPSGAAPSPARKGTRRRGELEPAQQPSSLTGLTTALDGAVKNPSIDSGPYLTNSHSFNTTGKSRLSTTPRTWTFSPSFKFAISSALAGPK